MRHLLFMCAVVAAFWAPAAFAGEPEPRQVQVVKDFVAAFNSHDSGAMANLVTEDVQWLSVDGDEVSVETEGKGALVSAMDDYFSACATCQSRVVSIIASGTRVSAVEEASWTGESGPRSQRAVSVYELSGDRIRRVYYFPAGK